MSHSEKPRVKPEALETKQLAKVRGGSFDVDGTDGDPADGGGDGGGGDRQKHKPARNGNTGG